MASGAFAAAMVGAAGLGGAEVVRSVGDGDSDGDNVEVGAGLGDGNAAIGEDGVAAGDARDPALQEMHTATRTTPAAATRIRCEGDHGGSRCPDIAISYFSPCDGTNSGSNDGGFSYQGRPSATSKIGPVVSWRNIDWPPPTSTAQIPRVVEPAFAPSNRRRCPSTAHATESISA